MELEARCLVGEDLPAECDELHAGYAEGRSLESLRRCGSPGRRKAKGYHARQYSNHGAQHATGIDTNENEYLTMELSNENKSIHSENGVSFEQW